ncbi:MAG: ribonuclease R family protein [Terriglobales bacterium]
MKKRKQATGKHRRRGTPPTRPSGRPSGRPPGRPPGREEARAPRRPRPPAQPPAADLTGIISLHRDGYAFVSPDPPLASGADVFIPPPATGGAMPGDRVAVRVRPRSPVAAGRPERVEGQVVAILERAHATVVGIFHRDPRGDYVQPLDQRLRERIRIAPEASRPDAATPHRVLGEQAKPHPAGDLDGMVVDVEITRFSSGAGGALGRVAEILGRRDDFGVDVEIMIRKHYLPHRFPDAALAEARSFATQLSAGEREGAAGAPRVPSPAERQAGHVAQPRGAPCQSTPRRDFRSLPIVTIDGETARDFDDAVLVRPRADGAFELQVHIADVAHYVHPGSPIDEEARLRGTSVYFPDRAVPMLPLELSTGLCSLRPHEDRLTMSCLMTIDASGRIVSYELLPGVIRSAARMTYTQVNAILEGDEALRQQFAPLVEGFEAMAALQKVLYAARMSRGSIDFDLPEPEIAFDEFGLMRSIVKSERNIAHRLIEEFMLSAASTVARHLESAGVTSVYRIHEQPEVKKVAEFEQIASRFGYSLGLGPLPIRTMRVKGRTVEVPQNAAFRISPRQYQTLTERIAGKPEERILSFLMLRSLKQARYSAHNAGHFALANDCYTHFTSPIRRYPDLLVHRILKALLAGEPAHQPLRSAEALESLCRRASEQERRADDAERELMDWKKVRFMEQRLGEEFPALILHATRDGFYVELEDQFIEGLVPAGALEDDVYYFRSTTQEWIGERSKRRYRLGERVTVRVERIDPVRMQIHFAPVVPPASGRYNRSHGGGA